MNRPFLVQKTRYLSSGNPDAHTVFTTFSPSSRSARRLTMGLPLDCLLPSGILYPLSQCRRPWLVMNIT